MGQRTKWVIFAFALSVVSWADLARGGDDPGDIVVEGAREKTVLAGGEWAVSLTRTYRFGKSLDKDTSFGAGKDREWHFCLADTQVESFVRLLVGQGRSQAAGTTICRPLQMRLGGGRLRARQTCQGGSVPIKDAVTGRVSTQQTRLTMYVTGEYGASELTLDFENQRELLAGPSLGAAPDLMRWSVRGARTGDCSPDRKR
nr:hypothetical protein [uncultured Novosphingobium sp.]